MKYHNLLLLKFHFYLKTHACILLLILCSIYNCHCQDPRTIKINLFSTCTQNDPSRNNLKGFQVHYYLDGQETSPWGGWYPIGRHNLRIILSPTVGMDQYIGSYLIAEIRLVDDNSKQEQRFTPNNTDATVSLNINPKLFYEDSSTLYVRIERCQGSEEKKSHVKIITSTSCTDGPNESVTYQGDITVSLGNKTYTSDAHGIIEADLPSGNYEISALWKDYTFGFVSQNGLRIKNKENGLPTITIGDKEETLEVRILTCEISGQAKARAVITEISDRVFVKRLNKEFQVFTGMQLRDGDRVKFYGPGKINWLKGNATISFENPRGASFFISPDYVPAGNSSNEGISGIQILQNMGSFFFPPGASEAEKKFQATTNSVVIGIKGTVFSLDYDAESETSTILVKEGIVSCYPKNPALQSFNLFAGQGAKVSMTNVSPISNEIPGKDDNTKIPDIPNYNGNIEAPSWSRGEQLLPITFDDAIARAERALKSEGYVNLFRHTNFIAGYKDLHTAVIMCNNAPDGKQWINIVVTSITNDSGIPGREREKLQSQMNTGNGTTKIDDIIKNIDWYKSAEEFRGKFGERFTFTCPVNDYPGHRLYGTDIYSDDSSICLAGVHAGAITFSGGKVTIEIKRAQDSFQGSVRNGATSNSFASWPGSFSIVK